MKLTALLLCFMGAAYAQGIGTSVPVDKGPINGPAVTYPSGCYECDARKGRSFSGYGQSLVAQSVNRSRVGYDIRITYTWRF